MFTLGDCLGTSYVYGMARFPGVLALLAAALVSVVGGNARADQADARLDLLFGSLQNAHSMAEASPITNTIWGIWIETGNKAADAHMATGLAAMEARDLTSALTSFSAVITAAPDVAEGWNKRATVYYLMGRHEDSIHDVQETLLREPRHFGALSGLGLIYLATGDHRLALNAFEQALAVNPYMPMIYMHTEALKQKIRDDSI